MIRGMKPSDEFSARLTRLLALEPGQLSARLRTGGPVDTVAGPAFIKLVSTMDQALAEQDGLQALAGGPFRVPEVLELGELGPGSACLVLEWLPLQPLPPQHKDRVAEALLDWHTQARARRYGWHRDNYIGASPQSNQDMEDWPGFFAGQRLVPQMDKAGSGLPPNTRRALESVVDTLPVLLAGAGGPVRVHGDLWRGNIGWADGRPALFDPAVYHAPPEVDLAMLALFGEPVPGLVATCRDIYGLDGSYELRRQVYDLYHQLNHFNLFGAGWAGAVDTSCQRLLAEVKA